MPADAVAEVIRTYPVIYHACHFAHPRTRSGPDTLSVRDSLILGHLSEEHPVSPAWLARHLSVGAPTVSEVVKRLERLGYVTRRRNPWDGRRMELRLTARGTAVIRRSSVLDPDRVERLLNHLTPTERRAAVRGLTLLARAARRLAPEDANGKGARRP